MLGITAMANTGLGFNQSTASGLNISKDASSVYTIVTTNTDPHVKCDALEKALNGCDYTDQIRSMNDLRRTVDRLEGLVDDTRWPLPKYREILFVY